MHELTGSPISPAVDSSQWWFEAVSEVASRRRMRERAEMETEARER